MPDAFVSPEPIGVHGENDRGGRRATEDVFSSFIPLLVLLPHQNEAACPELNHLRQGERQRYYCAGRGGGKGGAEEEKLLAVSSPTQDAPDG